MSSDGSNEPHGVMRKTRCDTVYDLFQRGGTARTNDAECIMLFPSDAELAPGDLLQASDTTLYTTDWGEIGARRCSSTFPVKIACSGPGTAG